MWELQNLVPPHSFVLRVLFFLYKKRESDLILSHDSPRCCNPHVILMMQVFLAKWKIDEKYYAIKVLQKKVILNRKEVAIFLSMIFVWYDINSNK